MTTFLRRRWLWIAVPLALLLAAASAAYASPPMAPVGQASPMHPSFPLLDAAGANVLDSGQPISTLRTCGECHDTGFITTHNSHADAGLARLTAPGETASGRAWEAGSGLFGGWDPLIYRVLSFGNAARFDLGTPDWLRTYGTRHVGGGPATTSRAGLPLESLVVRAGDPETHVLDGTTGEMVPWDWSESGTVELNCFLCHAVSPNNQARLEALQAGDFAWANTATLLGTGLLRRTADGFRYNPQAFDPNGAVGSDRLALQDPTSENCGLCHGLVEDDVTEALVSPSCDPGIRRTVTTGQIVSPERIADSAMNIEGKAEITRPWDIHAERRLGCTDCHASTNNPATLEQAGEDRPQHLLFDPRRLEPAEYLYRPSHDLTRTQSTDPAGQPAAEADRCVACHNPTAGHDWLPYRERHFGVLACETCHVPRLYSNALERIDWTTLLPDGGPVLECRGVEPTGQPDLPLVVGYQPTWLEARQSDGTTRLAPYNLVTVWFWIYGDPPQPVRTVDLRAAWFDGETYADEIVAAFDADGDGMLSGPELALDADAKVGLIRRRLEALGLHRPRIVGEVQPYAIHHDIASDEWALRECSGCHGDDSRLGAVFSLSSTAPAGGELAFVGGTEALPGGSIAGAADGSVAYRPGASSRALYVFGRDRVEVVDTAGTYLLMLVLAGIAVHGGLRYLLGRRAREASHTSPTVYLYGVYERLWHWLQTVTILLLLFTGLVIHRPQAFPFLGLGSIVVAHNVLAAILVVNAALSLFYHLASGEIRQFLPRPSGFLDQVLAQVVFYLRGIFRGERHPFSKRPRRKFNPLQQATYFGLLNVLLPLQVITGALMWGAQRWPGLVDRLGGLGSLAPIHTAIAWLLASFIVLHVYLTTTGATPTASLRAMMLGWEEIEAAAPASGGEP